MLSPLPFMTLEPPTEILPPPQITVVMLDVPSNNDSEFSLIVRGVVSEAALPALVA